MRRHRADRCAFLDPVPTVSVPCALCPMLTLCVRACQVADSSQVVGDCVQRPAESSMDMDGDVPQPRTWPRDGVVALKKATDGLCEVINKEYLKVEAAFGELETEEGKLLSLHQVQLDKVAAERLVQLDKVAAERLALDNEKKKMEGVQKFQSSRIKLNIGGTRFETSRDTLTKVEGSMLAAMFSGRHQVTPDDDGSFFIDRNGRHFQHILDYLRNGLIQVELNTAESRGLAVEAEFYGLNDLAQVMQADAMDIDRYLGDDIVKMRAQEKQLRQPLSVRKSVKGTDGPPIQPYEGLISIFEDDLAVEKMNDVCKDPMGFFELLARYRDETSSDTVPSLRRDASQPPKTTVANLSEFRENFSAAFSGQEREKRHAGVLRMEKDFNILPILEPILQEEPVFMAGGAVLRALTDAGPGSRRGHLLGETSDIDLFVCTQDASKASQVAEKVFEAIIVLGDRASSKVMRGAGVINIELHSSEDSDRSVLTVQIVLRLYESPAEVLLGFDVDCCCVGFDGERVWALPRAIRAIQHGCNILNPLHAWPSKASYEYRLVKYALRGYAIAVPGFESVDVDLSKIVGVPLSKLKGFARLVRLAMAFDDAHESGGDAVSPYRMLGNPCENDGFDYEEAAGAAASDESAFRKCLDMTRCQWGDQDSASRARRYGDVARKELGKTLKSSLGEVEFARLIYSSWWYCHGGKGFSLRPDATKLETFNMIVGDARVDGGLWSNIACVPDGKILKIPIRLEDAWDDAKRSREYLNARDTDLDARYFAHAARDKVKGHVSVVRSSDISRG